MQNQYYILPKHSIIDMCRDSTDRCTTVQRLYRTLLIDKRLNHVFNFRLNPLGIGDNAHMGPGVQLRRCSELAPLGLLFSGCLPPDGGGF